jgi:hypothetical protein
MIILVYYHKREQLKGKEEYESIVFVKKEY